MKVAVAFPFEHPAITVAGTVYDLTHLKAFTAAIPGKGVQAGTNLSVLVAFSNHVFTERTKHGALHHSVDHYGTKRTFDNDRYEMSKGLGAAIKRHIEANDLTYVSRSFGGTNNLVFLEGDDGRTWTIVYCLRPIENGQSVCMEVLSFHPKVVDQRNISRNHLSYYARKCLFDRVRIPNE